MRLPRNRLPRVGDLVLLSETNKQPPKYLARVITEPQYGSIECQLLSDCVLYGYKYESGDIIYWGLGKKDWKIADFKEYRKLLQL